MEWRHRRWERIFHWEQATKARGFEISISLLVVTMLLGFLHAWASGHSMNPDGMSYLDVGDAFYNHDWVHAVNAWGSPLYPWIVGSVLGIFKPSIEWEFPVVHLVKLGIFLLTALAFRSLLYGFIEFAKAHTISEPRSRFQTGVLWCVVRRYSPGLPSNYSPLHSVGPDMMVVACFYLSLSILGLSLGIGYWTKAIMFPLGWSRFSLRGFGDGQVQLGREMCHRAYNPHLTRQFAEGQGPNSTLQDEIAARYLRGKKGTLSYTKVAIIGDGTDAYWARLGKLRIVAEIMGGRGEAEFLDSPEEVRKSVYQAFRETGAKLIVMSLESCQTFKVEGWESIPGTQYYVHRLE